MIPGTPINHGSACPHCNGENTEKAIYCGFCGYAFYAQAPNIKYSGFARRTAAALVDGLILHICANIVTPIVFFTLVRVTNGPSFSEFRELIERGPEYFPESIANFTLLLYVSVYAVSEYIYATLLDSSRWQGTPGKIALGLKVTDLKGNRIDFAAANLRSLARFLSRPGYAGFFLVLLTTQKQTLHDYIAKCIVVHKS